MIIANIEANIEAKRQERDQIYKELIKLDNVIDDLKEQKRKLLEEDSDLYYEIEELKEYLNGYYGD